MITVSPTTSLILELGSAMAGAALALLIVGLMVWIWRDAAARSKSVAVRIGAIVLVVVFNVVGLIVYLLLRPRETLSERREREMIEEILAREVGAIALARSRVGRAPETL